MNGLAFFTITHLPDDPRCYVRVLPPCGGYDEMGYFATPERARAVTLEMYHTWAWELGPAEFTRKRDERAGLAVAS